LWSWFMQATYNSVINFDSFIKLYTRDEEVFIIVLVDSVYKKTK
jgi:hypothetical protein